MRGVAFVFFLAATLDSVSGQEACMSGNWGACGVQVAQKISSIYSSYNSWHDEQQVAIFGTTCTSVVKGGFYRWKWRWQGRFWCPQLSPIEGYSNNWESRKGAIEHAIEDYVQKGGQHGFLKANQMTNPLAGETALATTALDLTGTWRSSNGIYYLRHIGNELWWYGKYAHGLMWANVLHGTITGSTIHAKWADVPLGDIRSHGELTITIENNSVLQRTTATGGFGCSRWTRV